MSFAEVILPLPLQSAFTYAVPPEMAAHAKQGFRVIVPFGRKKFYTGIVAGVTMVPPEGFEVKEIAMTLDAAPVLRHPQLKLWQWVADYYMCGIGEVYKAAVPAGLKVESETFIEANPDYEELPGSVMSEKEAIILQLLEHEDKRLRIADIEKKTGFKRVSALIARMLERGAVIISERLVERYRSKKEVYVAPTFADADSTRAAFKAVKGAPKQETALLALRQCLLSEPAGEVSRNRLFELSGVTQPILSAMEKKGIITLYKKEVNRFRYTGTVSGELPQLSEAQAKALDEVHRSWLDHAVTLLHGVTSSGKTEIYIHLIDYVMKQRRQALLLVPEIALTTQLTHRLQRVFGAKVLIYHSKFSDNERVDLWRRLLEMKGEPCVVIAARSGVFLPFDDLGLVIVDEEHDSSYKQSDPAPRYNGRDTAMVLAQMHGAKTLLGSATPAVPTYYKALTGRYGLVELMERYQNRPLPSIELIDMKASRARGWVTGNLAAPASALIRRALEEGRQSIVFINRRGYAPMARCSTCGHVPKCQRCDVSLTYHRGADRLVCHYCGSSYPLPSVCPACKEHAIEVVGYGTERVEEEVAMAFPQAQIARMDLDTTRAKDSYASIIDDFSAGRKDILVGTQMVTKGLDFGGVSAVAVLNADSVLHHPDFMASERAFTMIEQVAGRAGRRDGDATVAVQTFEPDHPVFAFIRNHDYRAFYDYEIAERQEYGYPPFSRLIYTYLKHPDSRVVEELAQAYAGRLRTLLGTRVYGPDEPPVARVQSLYIRRVLVKIELNASMPKVKELLRQTREAMFANPAMRAAQIYSDVDPM